MDYLNLESRKEINSNLGDKISDVSQKKDFILIINCNNSYITHIPFNGGQTKISTIYKYLEYIYNINENDFWISYGGKALVLKNNTLEDYKIVSNSQISLNIRIRGGLFGDIFDEVIDIVANSIIGPIIKPIVVIGNVFKMIFNLLIGLIKLVIWLLQFILWLFTDLLNPFKLFQDLIGGVQRITRLIFAGIMDVIFGLVKYIFNKLFGPIFNGGLMGWDQATYKKKHGVNNFKNTASNSKSKNGKNNFKDTENDENGKDKLVDMKCHENGQKCYRTPDGQVPFSVIVATILLPPMGLFMEFGITGWLNIVICGILTLLFYFPGLIYALILIYC